MSAQASLWRGSGGYLLDPEAYLANVLGRIAAHPANRVGRPAAVEARPAAEDAGCGLTPIKPAPPP
jgi:hypothetical protein